VAGLLALIKNFPTAFSALDQTEVRMASSQ
jgi:hypothetical protein